jgi:hypothetical protein
VRDSIRGNAAYELWFRIRYALRSYFGNAGHRSLLSPCVVFLLNRIKQLLVQSNQTHGCVAITTLSAVRSSYIWLYKQHSTTSSSIYHPHLPILKHPPNSCTPGAILNLFLHNQRLLHFSSKPSATYFVPLYCLFYSSF